MHVSLEEFEKQYHGIEVGNIRRFLNKILFDSLDYSQPLVDYGCGGIWWKDDYWPRFPSVVGIEIVPQTLIELRGHFRDTNKYKLVFTPTGLTELPEQSFPQILSSSIVGFVLPKQAEVHLKECWRLLKPRGRLVLARINAYRFSDMLEGRLKERKNPGSFSCVYTKKDLFSLIRHCCPGYTVIRYKKTGFLVPKVPKHVMQKFYGYRFASALDAFVNGVCPFLGIHHFIILSKDANKPY